MMPRSGSTRFSRAFKVAAVLLLGALAACSDSSDMGALQQRIIDLSLRPGGEIEPMPTFSAYEAFTYSAASMRSPFDVPLAVRLRESGQPVVMVQPDENRTRQPLEEFALGSLTMVGMLSRSNGYIGLVQDENGAIHRVGRGSYMGRNHGRVSAVSRTQIDLIEIVPSGDGGWLERPRTLTLQNQGS